MEIPFSATNEAHKVAVSMLDADSNLVVPWTPDGSPEAKPVQVEATLNVGRSAHPPAGESQNVPLAFEFEGLALRELGRCSFKISLDGTEVRRLSLRVIADQN